MSMETRLLSCNREGIDAAAQVLQRGGLVALPTETVYGLGANALNPEAAARIYRVKGRPSDNPMIVHIARASDIGQLTPRLSPDIVALIDHFWPGPLTIVVPRKEIVPDVTTGGLDTVAVRMPDSPAALALIREAGCPIAAPSANLSGKPSPTKAQHVIDDLGGRIEAVIAGEDCRVGIESTVVDMTGSVPTILRPGILTAEDIGAALGKKVEYDPSLFVRPQSEPDAAAQKAETSVPADAEGCAEAALDAGFDADFHPKSPGMKYKHYAPNAEMVVIEGQRDRVKAEIERLKSLNERLGNRVGVILFEERAFVEAAHDLFADLQEMDKEDVDLILAGALADNDGVGFAVMNRMLKSAGYNIVKV